MAVVNFVFEQKSVEVEIGTTILEAARRAGVIIESPCNGAEICGKCKVRVDQRSLAHIQHGGKHHLSAEETEKGFVLACGAQVFGDINVEYADRTKENESLKVLSHGEGIEAELDSFITKKFSDAGNETIIYAGEREIGREEGNSENNNFGLVVDIGTTTLVTSLVDLSTGREIDSVSALNPQSIHAQDVLSRINFSAEEAGLQIMYSAIINEINGMIAELSERTGTAKRHIYEVVFSGNTCMLHLATNVNPQSMGRYPYTPEVVGGCHLSASEHSLDVSPFALIYLPPVISAYVGADITSGVLASNLAQRDDTTLFVDIGTNGEMVLAHQGEMSATSTAAGPAFEGMNITYGMRAGNGAIELFDVEAGGTLRIETIGHEKPIGICGSGLLDIVGELVAHGVINKNGRFTSPGDEGLPPLLRERLVKWEGKTVFRLAEDVYLSQKDIRQVQLAKGAIRAGIEFLLKSRGLNAGDVDKVLIAGSFGYHLRAKSLINIGLLPAEFAGRIEFVGNTSKSGGRAFLINQACRHDLQEVVKNIDVLDLAGFIDFDKVFVECLSF